MKIRNGFVSNSSSSSFIAVGIPISIGYDYRNINPKFRELVEKMVGVAIENIDGDALDPIWAGNGECGKDGVSLYTVDCEPFFVGLDLMPGLKEDKTLSEMKRDFVTLVDDKFGVKISVNDL